MSKIDRIKREIGSLESQLMEQRKQLEDAEKERALTPGDPEASAAAAKERDRMMREIVLPFVEHEFADKPELQVAVACVAQYWDDEAADAVHCKLAYSKNPNGPVLEKCHYGAQEWNSSKRDYDAWNGSDFYEGLYGYAKKSKALDKLYWDDNGDAIPAFAAFCEDDCNQEMDLHQAYSPYAVFRRGADGKITFDVVGKMVRPWLDGVRPEWEG